MGMFDSASFSPPDFNMGDDSGGMLRKFLRRKDNERMREEQQQQFQSSLLNIRKQQEMNNVSKTMNPANQTREPNVKFAPYNPGLDEFRRDQTQLGRDKLNLAKEKQQSQASLADRNLGVKEKLAALKDMPDSEKARLLQEGRITLQEIRDSEAMKRLETTGQQRTDQITQQGDIRTGQIDQQAEIDYNKIKKSGEVGSRYITERGDQARLTKGAPSSTPTSNSQQKVALQNRAVQMSNQNPELAQYLTFNDQGFPVIKPDAPLEAQMEIYKTIYGASPTSQVGELPGNDVNLPAGQPGQPTSQPSQVAPPQPNTGMPTDKFGVMQKTGMFKPGMEQPQAQTPMPSAPGNNSFVTMITPDGKGTRIVPKNQIQTAISQGYKPQGGGQ